MKTLSLVLTLCVLLIFSFTIKIDDVNAMLEDKRDGNVYPYVQIGDLNWMTENLRFRSETSMSIPDSISINRKCGEFYFVEDAFKICPAGWRLPTESEVEAVMKMQKKKKLNIIDTLQVIPCGRIDMKVIAKIGQQTTFWIDAELENGSITHWHVFGEEQKLHSHNVVNAQRQFPVRCVCESTDKD